MPQFQLSTPPKHWFRGYNTDVGTSQSAGIEVVADPKAVANYEAVPCADHNLAKLCFFEPNGTAERTARVHIYGYSPDGASNQFLPSFICGLDIVIGTRTGTGTTGPFLGTDLFADQITFVEGDDSIRIVSHNTSAAATNAANTIATVTIDLEGSTHLLVVFPALDGAGQVQNANFGYSLF